MTFSTKQNNVQSPAQEGGNIDNSQWEAWNEYYFGLIDQAATPVKNKSGEVVEGKTAKKVTEVGLLKLIVDLGTQPQEDSLYDSKVAPPKEGEELSAEEQAHINKYPNNYFQWVDGKRMQGKPERPTQEYAFFYDFPSIMVDWSKHPIEALHHLGVKPLRVSYNGSFSKGGNIMLGKHLRLNPHWKTGVLSAKNPISKIAEKSGLLSKFEAEEYDLGVLADSACKWELTIERYVNGDRTYFNERIKDPAEITEVKAGSVTISVEQQIPECDVEFMGILLNGMDYTPEMLEMLTHKRELMAVLPQSTSFQPNAQKNPDFFLGVNWEECDLCKALASYTPQQSAQASTEASKPKEDKPVQTPVVEEKTSSQAPEVQETVSNQVEDDDEWLDDCPF